VHLLTNGILLTEQTAARLFEAGVRSIAVSLDGATAETNDAIRSGGRFGHFEQIVSNLCDVARLRRRDLSRADVRIGVSFVIMRQNVTEVAPMIELCAELGLDWLKLEEAVPATPFAARSLLKPDEASVREAVLSAVARGRELGIVVVDHTAPPLVWRCKLGEQPEAAAFLAADEYANRSEIHPCRVPWEHVCIEPNGDVRMGDFFGPVLGTLAEAPLSSLWNGPVARAERRRSMPPRLCGAGPVTCVGERRPR
jgi:MoaA/NifB/PqqE/SkfB family radical SAM enzyme